MAYEPALAIRKAADLVPGQSMTDARDAFNIAETAPSMPHTLRAVDRDIEVLSALKVLFGFDGSGLCCWIFPALERAFPGTVLTPTLVREILIKYPGPTGLHVAGKGAAALGALPQPQGHGKAEHRP